MGNDEYAFVGGGSLKLKGVKDSKVDKRKRRKNKALSTAREDQPTIEVKSEPPESEQQKQSEREKQQSGEDSNRNNAQRSTDKLMSLVDDKDDGVGKTVAELRHEERRRKMLNDRLKREGNKTHKERVEELNKYLSGLSEHHDMPRIGPG